MFKTFSVIMFAIVTLVLAASAQAADIQTDVTSLLQRSAIAWNQGDLATFMQSYENSPQTVYISSKAIVHGYAAIQARYVGHYAPGQMGMLSFSNLAVRPLGENYAVAVAHWHVARTKAKGGAANGIFTVVLHRNALGWHIITDHSP